MHVVDEHGQPQNTKHDGRHGGQVRDIDLDNIGQPVLRREFFQIDRSRNPDGQRQRQHHEHHEQRAQHRYTDPRRLGPLVRGIGAENEAGVECLVKNARIAQLIDEIQLRDRDALVIGNGCARYAALDIAIHPTVGQKAKADCLADLAGVGDHIVPQLGLCRLGQDFSHLLGAQVGLDAQCLDLGLQRIRN